MTERVLIGHFLTRQQAARRAGIPSQELVLRPDLLHIGGRWLPEVYFEFQFSERGVHPRLGRVVQMLRRRFADVAIADWLSRPNRELDGASPLRWLAAGRDPARLDNAAACAGELTDNGHREARPVQSISLTLHPRSTVGAGYRAAPDDRTTAAGADAGVHPR
jgi:hypothetical protein